MRRRADLGCTDFDQCPYDAQAGQAQVLKGPCLAGGVEERVQKERDVGCSRTGTVSAEIAGSI